MGKEKAPDREQSVILDYELFGKIKELAEQKGISTSEQIKFILWDYFEIEHIAAK